MLFLITSYAYLDTQPKLSASVAIKGIVYEHLVICFPLWYAIRRSEVRP